MPSRTSLSRAIAGDQCRTILTVARAWTLLRYFDVLLGTVRCQDCAGECIVHSQKSPSEKSPSEVLGRLYRRFPHTDI
jgi:hypothetical protein